MKRNCDVLVKVNRAEIKRSTKRSKSRNPFPPFGERRGFSFEEGIIVGFGDAHDFMLFLW
jgi:hypothetical protein